MDSIAVGGSSESRRDGSGGNRSRRMDELGSNFAESRVYRKWVRTTAEQNMRVRLTCKAFEGAIGVDTKETLQ